VTYEEWSFIGMTNGWLSSGTSPTSKRAARNIAPRTGSQRRTLLEAYADGPLTDEEAGQWTGLADLPRCCYWKRCSELRQAGWIAPTGETRLSTAGERQQVCEITLTGRLMLG
jgi:hypothetical protein